eukprot:2472608-Amphidinium_carterae.1
MHKQRWPLLWRASDMVPSAQRRQTVQQSAETTKLKVKLRVSAFAHRVKASAFALKSPILARRARLYHNSLNEPQHMGPSNRSWIAPTASAYPVPC